jgi:salicylate hydroxylase
MDVDYDPVLGSITLADGTSHTGDLLVAADGLFFLATLI